MSIYLCLVQPTLWYLLPLNVECKLENEHFMLHRSYERERHDWLMKLNAILLLFPEGIMDLVWRTLKVETNIQTVNSPKFLEPQLPEPKPFLG